MVTHANPNARQIGRYVNDYDTAASFLGRKESRKLSNNTWVETSDDPKDYRAVCIRLHRTIIVTYYPDGRVKLNSGNYRTVTTKQRINQLLPPGFGIEQKDYNWYIRMPDGSREEFFDGAIIQGPPPREGRGPGLLRNPGDAERLTEEDVSATRRHDGSWEVAAIVNGYREARTYYGYGKREAVLLFIREMQTKTYDANPGSTGTDGILRVYTEDGREFARIRKAPASHRRPIEMALAPDFGLWMAYNTVDDATNYARKRQGVSSLYTDGSLENDDINDNPGKKGLVGYLDSLSYGEELKTFDGKGLGWKVDSTISNWRTRHGDRVYALLLKKGRGGNTSYAGGLWLGDKGTLFRGERFGRLGGHMFSESEAQKEAVAEAEYWLQIDSDDEDRDDEEQHGDRESEGEHGDHDD